jgi:hypothetical protein
MAPTILERGLPICGLRPNHVCDVSNAKPSEKDHELPGTFGLAVSIANHYHHLGRSIEHFIKTIA